MKFAKYLMLEVCCLWFVILQKICGINQAEDRVTWPDLLHQHMSVLASFREWLVVSAWLGIRAQPRNPCQPRNSASASTCLCIGRKLSSFWVEWHSYHIICRCYTSNTTYILCSLIHQLYVYRHCKTNRFSDIFWKKRWVGPVKLMRIIMFNISKTRPKSFRGLVKTKKFLLCLRVFISRLHCTSRRTDSRSNRWLWIQDACAGCQGARSTTAWMSSKVGIVDSMHRHTGERFTKLVAASDKKILETKCILEFDLVISKDVSLFIIHQNQHKKIT